ncbi:MAG: tRNA preQ1(34) S-adenosylmethionine ribosyltransferase-isomerase QueA [Desulfobulbus sp.]|jgi:S-adenosylmethionine:tRNA ribosyltransferase-isomerase
MIEPSFLLDQYDYNLPPERIAQRPEARRDHSRLLVLETGRDVLAHRRFDDIADYLRPGDLMVLNSTRVFPARLLGHKESGGKIELLLLDFPKPLPPSDADDWQQATATGLLRSSKRARPGSVLLFGERLRARVEAELDDGKALIRLLYRGRDIADLESLLEIHGQMPLPPYIRRPDGATPEDRHRYQTCYAQTTGSVAAPTAGLHFVPELLDRLRGQGVRIAEIVLHVGYGTFSPVRTDDIRLHPIHQEQVEITPEAAALINQALDEGQRIWAVGTTTVRALEHAADERGRIRSGPRDCDLFIYPGFRFRIIDNLITNFHLPKSSLLFLVSALAGRERILAAYQEAVSLSYRFFSYGDAMAIITRP